jgi:hypothetical protein
MDEGVAEPRPKRATRTAASNSSSHCRSSAGVGCRASASVGCRMAIGTAARVGCPAFSAARVARPSSAGSGGSLPVRQRAIVACGLRLRRFGRGYSVAMVFISATRLRVTSIFFLPGFIIANESSVKQLLKTTGFLGGKELIDKRLTFWTLTMWDAEAAMREFRNSSPHRKAMRKLPIWCDEASYVHWTQEEEQLPNWKTVFGNFIAEGRTSKVRNPSKDHLSKNFPEINWTKLQRKFSPPLKAIR